MVDIYTTENKYDIIYADPPWSYYNDMSVTPDCTTVKGMRRPPYPVLSIADICKIPVANITSDNALLFMLPTDYHLGKSMDVMKAWGFEYKTVAFIWAKKNKQGSQVSFMGAYTKKSGCEICLLGAKGSKAHSMVKNHKVNSFIEYPRQEHSKKPDIIRDSIVSLVGDEPKKIELFARDNFEGWDNWGNDSKIQ